MIIGGGEKNHPESCGVVPLVFSSSSVMSHRHSRFPPHACSPLLHVCSAGAPWLKKVLTAPPGSSLQTWSLLHPWPLYLCSARFFTRAFPLSFPRGTSLCRFVSVSPAALALPAAANLPAQKGLCCSERSESPASLISVASFQHRTRKTP